MNDKPQNLTTEDTEEHRGHGERQREVTTEQETAAPSKACEFMVKFLNETNLHNDSLHERRTYVTK